MKKSLSNSEAGSDNSKNAAYINISAERAWDQMKAFFKATLSQIKATLS